MTPKDENKLELKSPPALPPSSSPGTGNIDEFDEAINTALQKGNKITPVSTGSASEDVVNTIAENVLKKHGISVTSQTLSSAKLSMAVLAQEGATSPRFAENRTCTLFDVPVTVRELRDECKKQSTTIRRVARTLAPLAAKAGKAFDIEGNLAKSFKLSHPDATKEELVYASDFQTFSSDVRIPNRTRNWLMKNYNSRFTAQDNG